MNIAPITEDLRDPEERLRLGLEPFSDGLRSRTEA
ncbi:MAG: hypothetical protein JWM84_787 [Nocardioides sp.]|nr:hypothetical protein [Nocardioides sp.]